MNQANMIGWVKDINVRTTQGGVSICTFRLSVPRDFKDDNGKRIYDSFNIVTWRKLADYCSKYLRADSKVCVVGSMQNRSYDTKDGDKRYVTEIIADAVDFLDRRDGGAQGTTASQERFGDTENSSDLPF